MLSDFNITTQETVSVSGTSSDFRNELIECQHPVSGDSDALHMDGDYVFDASLDDYIEPETRRLLRELINAYPNAHLFIFHP